MTIVPQSREPVIAETHPSGMLFRADWTEGTSPDLIGRARRGRLIQPCEARR